MAARNRNDTTVQGRTLRVMQLHMLPAGPVGLLTANTLWTVDAHSYRRSPRHDRRAVDADAATVGSLAEEQDLPHRGAWLEQDADGRWRLRVIPAWRNSDAHGVLSGTIEQATIPLVNVQAITWNDIEARRFAYPDSPVPGDRDLAVGELPFTAFGQFGEDQLDLRVFDQDIYWVDRVGVPHRIESMATDYVRNVITMLQTRAVEFHVANVLRSALQSVVDADRGAVNGELLALDLGVGSIFEADPETWLESTPLLRKLRRTLAARTD